MFRDMLWNTRKISAAAAPQQSCVDKQVKMYVSSFEMSAEIEIYSYVVRGEKIF